VTNVKQNRVVNAGKGVAQMIPKTCFFIAILLFFSVYPFVSSSALEITSPSQLPDAVKGQLYSFQLEAEGAVGKVTWEIETGEMEYVEVETPHYFAGAPYAVRIMDHEGKVADADLPFVFPYYGERYHKVKIGRAGNFGFGNVSSSGMSESYLRREPIIAPLGQELYMEPPISPDEGDGVYAEVVPWRCVLTWRGRSEGSETQDRTFQGIIYPSGEIEFNYGEGNHDLDPVIGIGAGDLEHYVISVKNGATDLDRAPSSRFMLSAPPPKLELHRGFGIISGTPEQFGVFGFRVRATDQASKTSKTFSITVPGLFIHTRPGGVFIRRGEANPISWGGAGIGDRVTVRLYKGGELLETVLDNAPNEERVMWQPPDEYDLSDDYTIVVEDNSEPPLSDTEPLTIWDKEVLVPQCCATVQEGVDFAREGDTVIIAPGTYVENVLVKKKITLTGAGGGETVLDAGMSGSPLTVVNTEGVDIRDLTVAYAAGDAFGGIYCANSVVTIERCTIRDNSATFGAGIFLDECTATLRDCHIEGNTAEKSGGGVYLWQSRVLIDSCVIIGNSAGEGGGLFCWYSAPRIVRTVIAKNSAALGGGIVCDEAFPIIVNCTIADNSSTQEKTGGLHCTEAVPTESLPRIMNSIIWGNGGAISGAVGVKMEFCDTEDEPYAGADGNISEDPLFVNAVEGDYTLAAGSACIDAGNPDPAYNDEDGTRCDMGAFGGTGYVLEQSVITHIISQLSQDILIYWLAASFEGFVVQMRTSLEEQWSGGVLIDTQEPWRDSGVLTEKRSRFYKIRPVQ